MTNDEMQGGQVSDVRRMRQPIRIRCTAGSRGGVQCRTQKIIA